MPICIALQAASESALTTTAPFAERAEDIAAFVRGAEVIMHNAEFDEGFLNAEFARLKMPPLAKVAAKVVCSLILARRMHPQLPSHSLGLFVRAFSGG